MHSRKSWEKFDSEHPADARKRALKRRRRMGHAGKLTEAQKMHLLRERGNKCEYCGIELVTRQAHIDHKIPVALGGKTIYENLAITCERCNIEKGARTAEEYAKSKELAELRTREWDARAREIESRVGVSGGRAEAGTLPTGGVGSG